jgi:DNA ligase-1
MKRFAQLYAELDATTRTNEKVAALARYFASAPPADAAWGLHFLSGRRFRRVISGPQLVRWAAEETGLPDWLIGECHAAVGDLSETLALLLPDGAAAADIPLHQLVEERIRPLSRLDDDGRRALLRRTWADLGVAERFLFHKLLSGAFRVGVQRKLIVKALAEVAGGEIEPAVIEHRLTGPWEPTAADFARLLDRDGHEQDPARPYPFYLASPLEGEPAALGDLSDWIAEWKWDGIRAQLIRRAGRTLLWSRGEELIDDAFPEFRALGAKLPDGTVIDGEILAWDDRATPPRPLPFSDLQTRIHRKQRDLMLFPIVPVVFQAYDLLEFGGRDIRETPLSDRRAQLEAVLASLPPEAGVRLSPALPAPSWEALAAAREQARALGVEGIMLKRRSAPYRVGRVRGDWWKWKVHPYTIDAVLIYAQPGSGKRASLYTDYTFGVWSGGELVPVAKAYSGLTDEEIAQVDRFIRLNTVEKFGPMRAVKAELVFELAFDGLNRSTRHKAGVALRFPRMNRRRHDKPPAEADTLEMVTALLGVAKGGAKR